MRSTSPMSSAPGGTHALVMGGSIAGMLAARVLTDHFDRVTIIERDRLPGGAAQRKGVPHGRHVHTLLAKGWQIVKHYFPDIEADGDAGITPVDWPDVLCWYHYGGYKPRRAMGIHAVMASRPFVEWQIRRRVLGLPQVTLLEGCRVLGLVTTADRRRVTGVTVRAVAGEALETDLAADLVIDATGRGSRSPQWLEALGYGRPVEHQIDINFMYTSRVFRRRTGALGGAKAAYMLPAPPHGGKRAGALCSIEDDAWLVTLGGWLGEPAPQGEAAFFDFARTLPASDLYHAIHDAEPLTPPVLHRFPSNLRRRYEAMKRLPDGYLVLGDALCSVNPVYGQGMTASALAAATLDRCLARYPSDRAGFPRRFFRQVARQIDRPWRLAACEDFRYPEVRGHKAPGTDLINWYMKRVHQATLHDPAVYHAFLKVMHLLVAPTTLFHPRVVLRVLRARLVQRRQRSPERVAQVYTPAASGVATIEALARFENNTPG